MERTIIIDKNKNILLFGSRQTGKSTLVRTFLKPNDLYINLLPQFEFLKYSKDPARFHSEVLSHYKKHGKFLCIVDEIQKIPELLNDVHDLIESTKVVFFLTGSSARRLRQRGTNLLAGRALSKHLYPFTYTEIGEHFSLEKSLIYGTLPKIWNDDLKNHFEFSEFLDFFLF